MMDPSAPATDLVIDGQVYTLVHPGGVRALSLASAKKLGATDLDGPSDVAVPIADLSAGMGYTDPIVPNGYAWGENVDTRYRGGWTLGPTATANTVNLAGIDATKLSPTTASVDRAGSLLCIAGRYALTRSGTTWSLEKDFGTANVATGAINFKGVLVVATGADFLWTWDATGGWIKSGSMTANYLASVYWVVDGVGNFYLVAAGNNSVMKYIAPSGSASAISAAIRDATQWSADYLIGNTGAAYGIASLAASAHVVYFCKRNGVHTVDERGYSPNITPYQEKQIDQTNNGAVAWIHDGYLFVSWALMLDRIDIRSAERQDIPQEAQPGAGAGGWIPIFGRITALCSMGGWLAANVYNPYLDVSYICVGKDRRAISEQGTPVTGLGQMVWHGALVKLAHETVNHLAVHGFVGESPKLWVFSTRTTVGGNDGDGGPIGSVAIRSYPISLATNPIAAFKQGGSFLVTQDYGFAPSGALYTSDFDFGDPTATKQLYEVVTDVDNASATNTAAVAVSQDGGAYTTFGTVVSANQTLGFDPANLGAIPTGKRLGLRITLAGNIVSPPIVRSLRPAAAVIQDERRVLECRVELENYARARTGGLGLMSVEAQRTALQGLHDRRAIEVKVGRHRYVARAMPGYAEQEWTNPVDKARSLVAVVRLALIAETG